MKKSEEIQSQIDALTVKLKEAKIEEETEQIWDDRNMSDRYQELGFFMLDKAERILKLLWAGKTLLCRHDVYGDYHVNMNPQKNRIMVKSTDGVYSTGDKITEDTIMNYIVWNSGDWYLLHGK